MIICSHNNENEQTILEENEIFQSEEKNLENTCEENKYIFVHVDGAVKERGLIKIKFGSRVADAIKEAGGMIEGAELKNINLAHILKDEEKIYIPLEGENIEEIKNLESAKININTARQTELELINGIGTSLATQIIKYREQNGEFKSIEDIKNVKGIGESKFEMIKEYIDIK